MSDSNNKRNEGRGTLWSVLLGIFEFLGVIIGAILEALID